MQTLLFYFSNVNYCLRKWFKPIGPYWRICNRIVAASHAIVASLEQKTSTEFFTNKVALVKTYHMLGSFILYGNGHPCGHMGNSNSTICSIDMLTAWTAWPVCVNSQIFVSQLDINLQASSESNKSIPQ